MSFYDGNYVRVVSGLTAREGDDVFSAHGPGVEEALGAIRIVHDMLPLMAVVMNDLLTVQIYKSC